MATYLTLVNQVCKRLNEEVLTSANFSTAADAHATIKDVVNASIRDIQRAYPEWPWNLASRNFVTVAGTQTYTPAADVGNIDWDTFQIRRDDGADPVITAQALTLTDFTLWAQRQRPLDEQMTSDGWQKPTRVIRSPTNSIIISTPPNTVYTIDYNAWTVPDDLENWDDECIIPDKYNAVIVEGALKYMYNFRADTTALQISSVIFNEGIQHMLRIEIPAPTAFNVAMINQKKYSSWVAAPTYNY